MNSCLTTGEEQLQRRMQSGESFLHSQSLIKRADSGSRRGEIEEGTGEVS